MNRLTFWLTGLFAVQILLAGGLYVSKHSSTTFDSQQALLSFEQSVITKVVVQGENAEGTVVLEKTAENWIMPQYQKLPVNQQKLMALLGKLADIKAGWPVVTSASSQKRFEVAESVFQRKLQLFNGDELVHELFLGTSPSYRKSHARVDDSTDIFSVKLAAHELPVSNVDWLDKGMLKISDVNRIKGKDFDIARESNDWEVADVSPTAQEALVLNANRANELAAVFEKMRVQDVVSDVSASSPITVTVANQNITLDYQFFSENDSYYVTRNDWQAVFKISGADYEKIAQVNLNYLAQENMSEENALDQESVDLSQN